MEYIFAICIDGVGTRSERKTAHTRRRDTVECGYSRQLYEVHLCKGKKERAVEIRKADLAKSALFADSR